MKYDEKHFADYFIGYAVIYFCSNSIKSIVTEANSNEPIPSFATVYINGTTKGTFHN